MALSSAESELYALVKASSETFGVLTMMKEWDLSVSGEVMGDASAALGIIGREGLGKIRHIEVSHFWLQNMSSEKRMKYTKALGTKNPADMLTKELSRVKINEILTAIIAMHIEGKPESAPQLKYL